MTELEKLKFDKKMKLSNPQWWIRRLYALRHDGYINCFKEDRRTSIRFWIRMQRYLNR
jgi:hypothetical protein